jgi:RNA polymerase sigma-70 factor (ECF subfamily)
MKTLSEDRHAAPISELPRDRERFQRVVELYRRELLLHCYRFMGSIHDSEDLVQETFLRAWRSVGKFEGRASVKNWLYRIATNASLNALSRRAKTRRLLPQDVSMPATQMLRGSPATEIPWLEPYPDSEMPEIVDSSPSPARRYELRDTVRLAFIAATQRLPARQRAVLLLRDVLGWSANETAKTLHTSVASTNSALQRARGTLERRLSAEEIGKQDPLPSEQQSLADRYAQAWEDGDLDRLVELLTKDAALSMPPWMQWYQGRSQIAAFLGWAFDWVWAKRRRTFRFVATRANGQHGFAEYVRRRGQKRFHAHALHLLTFNKRGIHRVTVFIDVDLFSKFGLRETLTA